MRIYNMMFVWRRRGHRTRPVTPLQQAMRTARRYSYASSPRLWMMALVLIAGGIYWGLTIVQQHPVAAIVSWTNEDLVIGRHSVWNWLKPNRIGREVEAAYITTESYSRNSQMIDKDLIIRKNSKYSKQKATISVSQSTDGTVDDSDTNQSQSSPQQSTVDPLQLQHPSFYGWAPETFPNPMLDPVRCGIAYLKTDASTQHSWANLSETSSATFSNETFVVKRKVAPDPAVIRLCDPDWVLGTDYQQEIANALTNFSVLFGQKDWQNRLRERIYLTSQVRRRGSTASDVQTSLLTSLPETVELAVATVRKMNLPAVLRQGSFYAYEDEDDMVNDAAQTFARSLHDSWWSSTASSSSSSSSLPSQSPPPDAESLEQSSSLNTGSSPQNGILIFLSIQDRVCFISTGSELASILPWWRLDHVVEAMKPDLSHREYGTAVLRAIQRLCDMLQAGPPTLTERLIDLASRFGVVLCFAIFTFGFGAWGEHRDRRKRWHYAEQRSRLTGVDRDKARHLQREYQTRSCPICLESFDYGKDEEDQLGKTASTHDLHLSTEEDRLIQRSDSMMSSSQYKLKRVDSFGIPLMGTDGKPPKLLRCGHLFCDCCWKSWVQSGYGNPCNCPVCRQDVGRSPRKRASNQSSRRVTPLSSSASTETTFNRSSLIDSVNEGRGDRDHITHNEELATEHNEMSSERAAINLSHTVDESASPPSYDSISLSPRSGPSVMSQSLTPASLLLSLSTAVNCCDNIPSHSVY